MTEFSNDKNVETAFQELCALNARIAALPSLRPGEGYDSIGFALTNFVYHSSLSGTEKAALLSRLRENAPDVLEGLQSASISSEMEMEKNVILKILSRSSEENLPHKKRTETHTEQFNHVTRDYPYSWGFSRAEEQLALIQKMEKREIDAQTDSFVLYGRSMMPWSGLSLHFLSNAPVLWIDPFEESASFGKKFITTLEQLGIIKADTFKLFHKDERQAIADAFLGIRDKNKYALALDKDYSMAATYDLMHGQNVRALLLTETHGLAQLLYPPYNKTDLRGRFNLKAALIPPHAKDEDTLSSHSGIQLIFGEKPDVFLSTLYLTPTTAEPTKCDSCEHGARCKALKSLKFM